ncbi:MAG: ATP-binding protein, partial [Chitinispirillaceae bacterium]|nr:ATP-binding protein [Chitinispirillaceae bacterium]
SYIEESQRESIFNKFFGIQKTIGSLKGQNFGLGLTFSKMAVEALGGSIWIESNKEPMETYFKFKIKDFTVT